MNLRPRHPLDCHSEEERFYRDAELACRRRESAFRFCVVILRRSFSATKNLALRVLLPSFRVQGFCMTRALSLGIVNHICHSPRRAAFPGDEPACRDRESTFRFYVVILRRGFSAPKNLAVAFRDFCGEWRRCAVQRQLRQQLFTVSADGI